MQFRPLVIINICKNVDTSDYSDDLIEAILHMMIMVKEKMLLPYYVEKLNLLIDTSHISLLKKIEEFFSRLWSKVRTHFPATVHKVYVTNVQLLDDVVKEGWNRITYTKTSV